MTANPHNNRPDNQTKKDSEESDLEYLSRTTIISNNQADWLDEVLDHFDPEYLKPQAKAAITAKIAEERIEELKHVNGLWYREQLPEGYNTLPIDVEHRIAELKGEEQK